MISIIIPTYNRLSSLKECLESVVNQHQCGIEMVIVDDFSTDGTSEYLKDLVLKENDLQVVFNPFNAGVNYTRNRGIEKATKPFVMFLDSDDALLPNALNKLVLAIKEYPHANHFLSFLSYRSNEFAHIVNPELVYYEEWMSGAISGDFTHILRTDIMKRYLFFEQFRMFEQLNWYRIFRTTSPQLLLPYAVAKIDLKSTDSLRKATKAKTWEAVEATFSSESTFYKMYALDLIKYNPKYLRLKLLRNVILGMACKKRKASKELLKYANGIHIKIFGHLVTAFPYSVFRYALIKTGRVK